MTTATQERSKMDELRDTLAEELFGPDSRGESFMREQFDARWAVESEGAQSSIDALREAVSTKPPSAERPLRPMEKLGIEYDRLAAGEVLGLFNANGYNPAATGAELDGEFEDTREYLRAVVSSRNGYAGDARVRLITEAGDFGSGGARLPGGSGVGAVLTGEELELGGALVPEEYRAAMYSWALQPTSIRMRATVMPMNSATLVMPTVRDPSHSGTNAPFGIVPHWLEAGDEVGESQPKFGQVRLTAKAVAYRTVLNNTFLADSILAAQQFIFSMYPLTMMWEEEKRFMTGSGAGVPQGIINAPCAIDQGAPATTFTATEAVNMLVHLYEPAGRRAVWQMSRRFMPALRLMNIEANANEQHFWQDLAQPIPDMLMGYPVIFTEHAPAPGTTGDITLVDWSFYLIGDRQALSMAASEHSRFALNQTEVRGVARLDGQPWMVEAQTQADGNTVSPIVTRKS